MRVPSTSETSRQVTPMPAMTESSSTSRTGAGRDGGARDDLWQDQEPDGDGDRRKESEDAQEPKHATSVDTANVRRPGRGRASRDGREGANSAPVRPA